MMGGFLIGVTCHAAEPPLLRPVMTFRTSSETGEAKEVGRLTVPGTGQRQRKAIEAAYRLVVPSRTTKRQFSLNKGDVMERYLLQMIDSHRKTYQELHLYCPPQAYPRRSR